MPTIDESGVVQVPFSQCLLWVIAPPGRKAAATRTASAISRSDVPSPRALGAHRLARTAFHVTGEAVAITGHPDIFETHRQSVHLG